MFGRKARSAPRGFRIAAAILSILTLGATTAVAAWLILPARDPDLLLADPVTPHAPIELRETNPGEAGPFSVRTLYYGSGTSKRRPEFGPSVELKTETVDARPFVKGLKGFKARLRKWYWGFEPKEFPLNGRVWYPSGDGPFPLVLMVHGNHQMEEFSDPGYGYLGELLASRGFIFVSVDENFLNGSIVGGIEKENDARGWILLKHLEAWHRWNAEPENRFHQKVDTRNIALIGHSRGGEAVAIASAFNRLDHYPDDARVRFEFEYSIRTLIAIAPIDGQYEPANQPTPLENVNYLVLHGSHDADVSTFAGHRPYHRMRFTGDDYWVKAGLYIYRANHGQFNTVWGDTDIGPPFHLFLNHATLLSGTDQRQIAKVFISAFLEMSLRGKRGYVAMFRNPSAASRWLPTTIYLSQFEDSRYRAVSTFDDGIDVTKTTVPGGIQKGENLTVWREEDLKGRGGDYRMRNKVVVLGWHNEGSSNGKVSSYSLTLPEGLATEWRLDTGSSVLFSLANTNESPLPDEEDANKKKETEEKQDPIDLTLELIASDGISAALPLSRFCALRPALKVKLTRWKAMNSRWYKNAVEPILQTFELPLAEFALTNPSFRPEKLQTIRFRFDRSPKGVVMLDEVGFQIAKGR
jgi:dienelactone hydrolase